MSQRRYVPPSVLDRLLNPVAGGLMRLGLCGSRTLAVRGRKSGEWRTVPVNLLARIAPHHPVFRIED